MRTLIVSDLHLGSLTGSDVLRHAELRTPLLEAVADADRLVLLGDVLELRHGPPRNAMAAARPFFEDLGQALGERELVMVAGNHDHALIEPWLMRRGESGEPPPLEVEQLIEPAEVSRTLEQIAAWAAPARVRVAYPGLWVRPDVYATHGHYLDCHLTIPTLERLSMGLMSRVLGRPAEGFTGADDYEAVESPGIRLEGCRRQERAHRRPAERGDDRRRLARAQKRRPSQGRRARVQAPPARPGGRGFPLAVAALNRAGLGPLRADISGRELRRAGLEAMGEVAARLELGDAYVVFGHTHRAGPLPDDDPAEWRPGSSLQAPGSGARLVNTGCWTYARVFLDRPPPGRAPTGRVAACSSRTPARRSSSGCCSTTQLTELSRLPA